MVDVYSGGVVFTVAALAIDGLTIEVVNKTKGTTTGELWGTAPPIPDTSHPSPTWNIGDAYQAKGRLINRAAGAGAYVEKANQKVILVATIGGANNYMEDQLTNAQGYVEFNRTVNPVDNWEGKKVSLWLYTTV